jgi:hypothetical protein
MQEQFQPRIMQVWSHLENDSVLRTNCPSLWRSVLFQRSTCAVSPVPLPPHMLRRRNHGLVRLPEIRVAGRRAPGRGHLFPQKTAALLAAVAQAASDDLPRVAVQRHPDPGRFFFRAHKGPEFVQLQHRGGAGSRGRHGAAQGRERGCFFLSQLVTVLRETPKVRLRPRRLERSW